MEEKINQLRKEWGVVKNAPFSFIICFSIGAALSAMLFGGLVFRQGETIAIYEGRIERDQAEFSNQRMAFKSRLDAAIETGKSQDIDVSEALNICRQLVPELDNFSSDLLLQAAQELVENGCESTASDDCKIPAVAALLDSYLGMRINTRRALGMEAEY